MPDTITEAETSEAQQVLECTERGHPATVHKHWDSGGLITYSGLDYVSSESAPVEGLYGKGEHVTQEPVVNDTTPQWPIRECPHGDHPRRAHYHVVRGREWNPDLLVMSGGRVYQGDGYATEPGMRYAKGEHVTPATPPVLQWAPGTKWRVTSEAGGHGFPVGTIVTALMEPYGAEGRNCLDYFHATTLEGIDYTQGSRQHIGTTAWVHATDIHIGHPNVERVVEPGDTEVQECDEEAHPETEHSHWTHRGQVLPARQDWRPADPTRWVFGGTYAKGSQLVKPTLVSLDEEQRARLANLDLPPEEVLRIIRENPDEHRRRVREYAETIESLLAEVEAARSVRDEARRERAEWMNKAITVSRQYANNQSWCGVYDEAMRELGLPGRRDSSTEFDVEDEDEEEPETEEVTVTQYATVTATYTMDDSEADDWLRASFDATSADFDYIDTDGEIEVSVRIPLTTTVEVTEGNCGCGEIDDWGDYLPGWVTRNHLDWTIDGDEECSND